MQNLWKTIKNQFIQSSLKSSKDNKKKENPRACCHWAWCTGCNAARTRSATPPTKRSAPWTAAPARPGASSKTPRRSPRTRGSASPARSSGLAAAGRARPDSCSSPRSPRPRSARRLRSGARWRRWTRPRRSARGLWMRRLSCAGSQRPSRSARCSPHRGRPEARGGCFLRGRRPPFGVRLGFLGKSKF